VEAGNFPFILAGRMFAMNLRGLAAGITVGLLEASPVLYYYYKAANEAATSAAMARIQIDPESNADLLRLVRGGLISNRELEGILRNDSQYVNLYLAGFNDQVKKLQEAMENPGDAEPVDFELMKKNVTEAYLRLDADLKKLGEGRSVLDPQYLVLKRRRDQMKNLMRSLGVVAKN